MVTDSERAQVTALRLHEVSLELFRAIAEEPQVALNGIACAPVDLINSLKMMAEQLVTFYESNRATSPWLGYLAISEGQ